jgi:valyl-tRNA synthetase
MGFSSRYHAAEAERRWQTYWASERVYEFNPDDSRPIFAIDTPPPTVSGDIHIGHVYSYTQAEAMARFWRMQGYNVYYPFGFDDNGLPTERFVEKRLGQRARDVGRDAFIAACLDVSREVEDRFEAFWKALGFSVDWRLRYSTIDPNARRTSQWSFLDLYRKGLVYRAQAPNPWCVECQTAIAQAEMDDTDRETAFYTLQFQIADCRLQINPDQDQSEMCNLQSAIQIATTRPELLPACVAVFVHPDDSRYAVLVGHEAITPLFGRRVPILADAAVDPSKGTGAVMCCTFGDTTDVMWWREHQLPLIPLVTRQGRLSEDGGPYAGLTLRQARERIVAELREAGAQLDEQATAQTVRVHERCGTPLEILETSQWFIRVLDAKAALLDAGRQIAWHPAHMHTRYEHWVSNLNWDWCISRQRFFGVPFPVWHCDACGGVVLADESQLPVDPMQTAPPHPCACGNADLRPDPDVMDTWATSSVSPQIAGQMLDNPALFERLFPMQLRPQAHDIIRTWAFYTIAKSHFHFGTIPWETLMISGHALAPAGGKISKSKGNSAVDPAALIERYGADALRYWACSGSIGADQQVDETLMKQGVRLVTKLWNAARFIGLQIADCTFQIDSDNRQSTICNLQWSDRFLLSSLQRLVAQATGQFRAYDYAAALEATERFFWNTLCDNYLEWVKGRLYDGAGMERAAAQWTLHQALLILLKLFAPVMPHITEEIYQQLFAHEESCRSIHLSAWPVPDDTLLDSEAERVGMALLALTTAARRWKTARQLSLGAELAQMTIAADDDSLRAMLEQCVTDIQSVTRAREVIVVAEAGEGFEEVAKGVWMRIAH